MSGGFKCRHLTVVGLGLMGGSLACALRERAEHITGVDRDPATLDYALKHKIVDAAADDLKAGVSEADVVILAAPVRAILHMLDGRIGSYLRSNTLLIDIGSTKADIVDAMANLPIGVQAIGGHPMTGKESNGVEASDGALYRGRPFVLCAARRTTPAARERALALVDALGALPIEMDAHKHDQVVAAISHLPYLLSAALVATVAEEGRADDAVWNLAAGGFRDMSRLAGSDIKMMGDILSTNTRAVAKMLALFRRELAMIEAMLISQDDVKLAELLRPAREARLEWMRRMTARTEAGKHGT
ncbi:MAG: prephenate dehydrogenase [Anaerolinea sp.]|nr:prephenate dehydrogenase [Anaerolinea sp.]